MGLLLTLGAFVGGYVAGMNIGDRPIEAAKGSMSRARDRAMSGASTAFSGSRPSMDVRRVRELMTSSVESVRPDTPLREAAKTMQSKAIGDVLVVSDSGELRGIVTDRDLAIRAVAEERDPGATEIGEVMSPIAVTVPPEATVSEAIDLMRRHDVRRLPVVEQGRPVGIVSLGDVSRSSGAGTALADISKAPANN
jgi:CBS domain-containing protein